MILAVDIGNTHIVLGLYDNDRLAGSWRIDSNVSRTADDYGHLVCYMLERSAPGVAVDGVVIGSVVPRLAYVFEKLAERYFGQSAVELDGLSEVGVTYRVDTPHELIGADRIANALAVKERYRRNCIVVDTGTATTFDLVTASGEYLGGVIAPGVRTSADALSQKAAMLHRVDIEPSEKVIGKNTGQMMISGIFHGAVCQIDGLVEKIKKEWGVSCKVIGTGGLINMLARFSTQIDLVDPNLTLDGLRIAYDKLSAPGKK